MEIYNTSSSQYENENSKTFSMIKIYAFMALALLITGLVGYGLPYLLVATGAGAAYLPIMIVSAIVMIPMMIVIQLKAFKKTSKAVPICFFVYSVAMGCLLSSILMVFDLTLVAIAFIISAGTFGVMALFGAITKNSLNGLLPIVFTAVIGASIISLVNLLIGSEAIYWIAEFVMFGAMLLITAIDMNNIKKIAMTTEGSSTNVALFCAFNLYVDFIYIFIRVLYYVALFTSNRK